MAVVIYFSVRDVPRGKSEPELADLDMIGNYRFDWKIAKDLFKKPSLLLLFSMECNYFLVSLLPGNRKGFPRKYTISCNGFRSHRSRHRLSGRRQFGRLLLQA